MRALKTGKRRICGCRTRRGMISHRELLVASQRGRCPLAPRETFPFALALIRAEIDLVRANQSEREWETLWWCRNAGERTSFVSRCARPILSHLGTTDIFPRAFRDEAASTTRVETPPPWWHLRCRVEPARLHGLRNQFEWIRTERMMHAVTGEVGLRRHDIHCHTAPALFSSTPLWDGV